jgi:hypothetical protein
MHEPLTDAERQHLERIARALELSEKFAPDAATVDALIKKGMVRTKDGFLRLTDAGLGSLGKAPPDIAARKSRRT